MEDLRTNKEILHQLENRIDEINFYLYGVGRGKYEGMQINSRYGETTLRGRIGNNVESLLDEKLNKIEEKLEKPVMTYGEFGIILGSIFIAFLGCLAWILLT
jgi:BioD-like phosphotransacetylase family protein